MTMETVTLDLRVSSKAIVTHTPHCPIAVTDTVTIVTVHVQTGIYTVFTSLPSKACQNIKTSCSSF